VPKTVLPIRKAIVKRELLKGKSTCAALRAAGYAESTVAHNNYNPVVKQVMQEIAEENILAKITPEYVIKGIERIQALAVDKGDMSTAMRAEELKGKYLAMFRDKSEVSVGKFDTDMDADIDRIATRYSGQVN
jgi:hypothetical protein